MRREGMLYRYLRDYTPNSPMNSPLDAAPYDLDGDEEIIDTQGWWNDGQQTNNNNSPSVRRDSSPNIDPMDTSAGTTKFSSVPPISIPEPSNRRPSTTPSGDQMHISPTNTMTGIMPPPMLPRLKRKGIPPPLPSSRRCVINKK